MLFFVLVESAVFIPLVSLSFLSLGPAFFSPSYFLCPRLTFFKFSLFFPSLRVTQFFLPFLMSPLGKLLRYSLCVLMVYSVFNCIMVTVV